MKVFTAFLLFVFLLFAYDDERCDVVVKTDGDYIRLVTFVDGGANPDDVIRFYPQYANRTIREYYYTQKDTYSPAVINKLLEFFTGEKLIVIE